MAKLAIHHGDALEREVDLTERGVSIGRGDTNDVVLADPTKSLSRLHARVIFENGHFVVMDLNSQNGTWVGGRRVQRAVLEPGDTFVLGGYRFVLVAPAEQTDASFETVYVPMPAESQPAVAPRPSPPAPAAPPRPAPAVEAGGDKPTLYIEAPKPAATPAAEAPGARTASAPVARPPETTAPPAAQARPEPPPPKAVAAPPPPPPPRPMPAPPPPVPKPAAMAAAARAPKPAGKGGFGRAILYVAAALVVIAAGGYAFMFLIHTKPPDTAAPTPPEASSPARPAAEPAKVEQPAEPPVREVPAPPGRARARADVPPETPRVPRQAVTPREPTPPVARIPVPVTTKAATGGRRGERGAAPAAPPGPAPSAKAPIGERLAQARIRLAKGEFLEAIALLQGIVEERPDYEDAAGLLDTARAGAKNAARQEYEAGVLSEGAGDIEAAGQHFEQALKLDPALRNARDGVARLNERKKAEGEDAYRRAKQYDALGRVNDAIAFYEKALQLLPPDHPLRPTAKERVDVLRSGK